MKTTYTYLLLLLLFTIHTTGCKKDLTKNATLPAATQEGRNTVGFTIDGEVWVPYYKCGAFDNPCREMSADYGFPNAARNSFDFQIVRKRGDKSSSLTVSSSGISTITTVGNKIDSISAIFIAESSTGNTGYFTGPLQGSKFLITKIDYQNRIISGEFEFVLPEQNGSGRTTTLKDGRFDFKFNACKCSN